MGLGLAGSSSSGTVTSCHPEDVLRQRVEEKEPPWLPPPESGDIRSDGDDIRRHVSPARNAMRSADLACAGQLE